MAKILPASFYLRDTVTVARRLLGQRLVHIVNGERLSGRIVEVEAYLGSEDRACHSFGHRRTPRTESMYLPGGHAYVYLIYGMHHCFNVVTRDTRSPEAVLVRALEPDEGIETQRLRRKIRHDLQISNGPGKLCSALAIDKSCDRLHLSGPDLFIEELRANLYHTDEISASPRIGVDYAGEAASWPLRFALKQSQFVSRPLPPN